MAERLATRRAARAAAGRTRRRRTVETLERGTVQLTVDGQECLAFCSNDYLGLAQHPRVVEAFVEAARRWGVGSGASHLVSGHTAEHHALETELAHCVARPRALLFSSGYMANLALGSVLAERGDAVFEDRLNHASLLDAGLASGARFGRYPHANAAALARRLARRRDAQHCLVLTDGVFSMDGDVAPLRELAPVCREARATLVVDDAHGFGVLGKTGAGSVEAAALTTDDVPLLMCTLGKAAGTFGAFVAGNDDWIDALLQSARTYIYTTALPPAVAAATRVALQVMREEAWRREHVLGHAHRFRASLEALGLAPLPSQTPIQALVLGDEVTATRASDALFAAGIWVPAIRPPTVPSGQSRLRFTFSARHTSADVDRLLDAVAQLQRAGLVLRTLAA